MANIVRVPAGGGQTSRGSGFLTALVVLTLIGAGAGAALAAYVYDYTEGEVHGRLREQKSYSDTLSFTPSTRVQKLDPLVTNLASPKDAWIRIQASILLDQEANLESNIVRKKIEDDFLAYMRTLTLSHLEGGIGLQHLREDLTERAKTRTKGQVQEIMLESVVIQ
ncbi:flagellar basal body-associated FliL family protein [Rhodobacterales bacterium]|nr:flagellar basal body-associated FliL family protein [Rhodobacterales bacterium]